jgi:predicted Zn-dependent peptidase
VIDSLADIETQPGTTLADALTDLGSRLESEIDPDFASLSFTVLREQLEPALRLVTGAIAKGPSDQLLIAALQDARKSAATARGSAVRTRAQLLACAVTSPCNPALLDGSGSEATLSSLMPSALSSFYKARYNSGNAVAVVSGPGEVRRLASVIETGLPSGTAAPRPQPQPLRTDGPKVTVIDSPGASQASVLLLQILPAGLAADPLPAELVTLTFRQRLMETLRTEKGWSYEMYPYGNRVGRSGSLLHMNIPLQPDKVGLAIREVEAEAARLRSAPVEARFMATTKGYLQGGIVSGLTSLQEMNNQLLDAERGGLGNAYYRNFLQRLPSITPEEVQDGAKSLLNPDAFVWAIAGDLRTLRPALEAEKIRFTVAAGGR